MTLTRCLILLLFAFAAGWFLGGGLTQAGAYQQDTTLVAGVMTEAGAQWGQVELVAYQHQRQQELYQQARLDEQTLRLWRDVVALIPLLLIFLTGSVGLFVTAQALAVFYWVWWRATERDRARRDG